jgi:titin
LIGTDAAGLTRLPNRTGGISVNTSNDNIIGGTSPAARNVISGNGAPATVAFGINILNSSSNNQILGNYIGTDVTGTAILANSSTGVNVNTGTASGNIIGGGAPGAGNVISGNGLDGNFTVGIFVGSGTTATTIRGNRIGTNAAGTAALPNANGGVNVSGSNNNVIGGTAPGEGNLISGNGSAAGLPGNLGEGISLIGANTGNQIRGNLIGTDVTGILSIPNGSNGVELSTTSSNTVVGGSAQGAANVIAFNAGAGILLFAGGTGAGNLFSANSIFDNTQLGIDLGGGGSDPNDAGDGDTGENDNQNSPVIGTATSSGAQTTITGTLNSTPNAAFTLEFFSNTACDPSGRGEGRTYLGSLIVNTNGSGDATINAVFGTPTNGLFITATATNGGNSTSEFSNCVPVP